MKKPRVFLIQMYFISFLKLMKSSTVIVVYW